MSELTDLTGQRFGKWFVINRAESDKFGHAQWLCRCDCGNEKIVNSTSLKSGRSKNCGCITKERLTKHNKFNTRLYRILHGMKGRCYNSKNDNFKNYGGRGITICQEWLDDFMNFYNWAINNGYSDELSIDRINNDGNYEPSNCRWADVKTQSRNTSRTNLITFNNETMCLRDWAKKLNINESTLNNRIRKGWNIEKALTTPVKKRIKIK